MDVDKGLLYSPGQMIREGCECCEGDEPLIYLNNQNCAFVDSKGEIMVMVSDKLLRFKVKCCPNYGRRF